MPRTGYGRVTLVRWRSIFGVVALALAVSGSAVGPAFAQTPVAPTTATDPPPKDDPKADKQPKPDKQDAEVAPAEPQAATTTDVAQPTQAPATEAAPATDKTKPEKAKVDKPKAEKPAPEKPKADKPAPDEPKADKPAPDEPKADKPKPADEQPKPAKPAPADAKPKPDAPKPAAAEPPPLHAEDGLPSDQAQGAPTAPAPTVSAQRPSTQAVLAARTHHVATVPASHGGGTTTLAYQGGTSDGAPVPGAPPRAAADPVDTASGPGRAATPTTHAARIRANNRAEAATPAAAQRTRTLPLDPGPSRYDLTLLLTILCTAGAAYLIGRQTRRRFGASLRR
jgi:hypothetical protein